MASDPKSPVITIPPGPHLGMSARTLAREVFRAASPEQFVQSLPAQSVYLALHALGLEASHELLALATNEQYKVILDFELWQHDQFSEDNFFRWLHALEAEPGLEGFERLVEVIDLRLLGLMVTRHVEAVHPDEPSEAPPEPGFYTPDKGSTWIRIRLEDPERKRMFAKLLALIFEEESRLFYQLITESGYVTSSELEEDAFADKCRRLWSEGFPDPETSAKLHAPCSLEQLRALLPKAEARQPVSTPAVLPLAHSLTSSAALLGILREVIDSDEKKSELEAELALLANAAVVFFGIDASDPDELAATVSKIRACLNLGAERVAQEGLSGAEVVNKLGLQRMYQLGLAEVKALRKFALALSKELTAREPEPVVVSLLEAASLDFPMLPAFVRPDGSLELSKERLDEDRRPYSHLKEIEAVKRVFSEAQVVH